MSERKVKAEKPNDLVLIGDYLRNCPKSDPASETTQKVRMLLEAITRYAFYPGLPGLKRFADDLQSLANQLADQTTPTSNGTAMEATIGLLAEHRTAKDELDRKQRDEIQEMVVMFHRSMAALMQGSHRSADRLLTLEKDLKQASGLSDIMALRGRLNNVLEFIRQEREEERTHSTEVVGKLEKDFRQTQSTLLDCGVGMPGREQAIATLKRVWLDDSVGAIVRLDQLAQVAERHGNETSQRLLQALLNAIAQQITIPHSAFLWNSNAVLLLMERTGDRPQTRMLIRQKAASIPAAFPVEVASRKSLFRCPHNWLVLGSDEESDVAGAIARFDVFLNSATGAPVRR